MFFLLFRNCFVRSFIVKVRFVFIKASKSISLLKSNLKKAEVRVVSVDEYYKILQINSIKNLYQKRLLQKFFQNFLKSYQIDKIIDIHRLIYKLYILAFIRLYLVFPISILKPFYSRLKEDLSTLQELYIQGNNIYKIETILNYKENGYNRHFYIKWKDYEDKENIQESRRNIFIKELLADYKIRLELLR